MSEGYERAIDHGLAEIRAAVKHQLGVERPSAVEGDPDSLVRLSPDLPRELKPDERRTLEGRAAELDPWLQGPFLLGGDLAVGGEWRSSERWRALDEHLPPLTGRHVLDVGTNAGYDAFMFNLKGAGYVMACEPHEFIRQARFLESIYQTGVDLRQIGWEALDPEEHGRFDLVHCHGVLYHELHLVHMVERLGQMLATGGTLLLGSMILAEPALSEYARFVPAEYYGDPTWWWVPGPLVVRWILETAGMVLVEEFGRTEGPPGEFPTMNAYFVAQARQDAGPTSGSIRLAKPAPLELEGGDPVPALIDAEGGQDVNVRFSPGHFYSPLPDTRELAQEPRRSQVWPERPRDTPGIDWRAEAQLELCNTVFGVQERLDIANDPTEDAREYYASNDQFQR